MASQIQNPVPASIQILPIFNAAPSYAKVQYSNKVQSATFWLGVVQLLLAMCCVICQAIATAFNVVYRNEFLSAGLKDFLITDVDYASTGVWMGLFTIVTAALGIAASRRNRKSLIITHLVLNAFVIIFSVALIGTSAATIDQITYCRGRYGLHIDIPLKVVNEDKITSYALFGEVYTIDDGLSFGHYGDTGFSGSYYGVQFHCKHAMFRGWIACSCILLISALMIFIISLTLLVFNSKAACLNCCSRCCCRSCSECCCCDPSYSAPVPVIAYQTQPFIPAQTVINGSQVNYPVYAYPAAHSTSQAAAPLIYPNMLYNQAPTVPHTTYQSSFQPAEVKSTLPPGYTE